MKTWHYNILLLLVFSFTTSGCDIKNRKTTIEIVDNHRHYYPIMTGQELDIMFEINNTGENALFLDDIITSCGCITLKKSSVNRIPAGKTGHLFITYDSRKNVGYVKHYITLYGNFATSETQEIVFDVNVVPDALYTKDYEELYREKINKEGGIKRWVEGDENNRGYYVTIDKESELE